MGFRVQGTWFMAQGSVFNFKRLQVIVSHQATGVQGSGSRVQVLVAGGINFKFRVQDPGFRVQVSIPNALKSLPGIKLQDFRVQGSGFMVQVLGINPKRCQVIVSHQATVVQGLGFRV